MLLNTRETDFAASDRLLWKFSSSTDLSCDARQEVRLEDSALFPFFFISIHNRDRLQDTHGLLMQQRDGKLHEETGNWGGRCQKVDYKKHSEKLSVCYVCQLLFDELHRKWVGSQGNEKKYTFLVLLVLLVLYEGTRVTDDNWQCLLHFFLSSLCFSPIHPFSFLCFLLPWLSLLRV